MCELFLEKPSINRKEEAIEFINEFKEFINMEMEIIVWLEKVKYLI